MEDAQALGVCQLDGHDMRWQSRCYVLAISQFRGSCSPQTRRSWFLGQKCVVGLAHVLSASRVVVLAVRSAAKGNLCINPTLGMKMVLHCTSVKVRGPGRSTASVPFGRLRAMKIQGAAVRRLRGQLFSLSV